MISPRRSLSHLLPPTRTSFQTLPPPQNVFKYWYQWIILLLLLLNNNHYYYPGPPRSKYCPQTPPANSICARKHTWMTWPFRIFQVLSYRKAFSVVFPLNLCVKESTFSISYVGLSPSLCRDCPDPRSKLSTCTCYILQFLLNQTVQNKTESTTLERNLAS